MGRSSRTSKFGRNPYPTDLAPNLHLWLSVGDDGRVDETMTTATNVMVQERATVDGKVGEWKNRNQVFRSGIAAGHLIQHLTKIFNEHGTPAVKFEFRHVPTDYPVNC